MCLLIVVIVDGVQSGMIVVQVVFYFCSCVQSVLCFFWLLFVMVCFRSVLMVGLFICEVFWKLLVCRWLCRKFVFILEKFQFVRLNVFGLYCLLYVLGLRILCFILKLIFLRFDWMVFVSVVWLLGMGVQVIQCIERCLLFFIWILLVLCLVQLVLLRSVLVVF